MSHRIVHTYSLEEVMGIVMKYYKEHDYKQSNFKVVNGQCKFKANAHLPVAYGLLGGIKGIDLNNMHIYIKDLNT